MMPVLRLSDATFAELAILAKWLGTRTPSEAIDKLVREKADELGIERDVFEELDIARPQTLTSLAKTPGLSFTRVTGVTINGAIVAKTNWASVLLAMISVLKAKGLSGSKLCTELQVPAKATEYSEDGYTYHPELGISVQGQAAQDAWREVERIARKWAIPVRVEFEWRQNAKAERPGQKGVLEAGHK